MSILNKLGNLRTASDVAAIVEMTNEQALQCKAALKRDGRGPSVMVNRFNIAMPYRVSTVLDDVFTNHGNFVSADVAAAVGTIASMSVFGDKALRGFYDESVVEGSEEFQAWLLDTRNAEVLARVNAGTCLIDSKAPVSSKVEFTETDVDGPVF